MILARAEVARNSRTVTASTCPNRYEDNYKRMQEKMAKLQAKRDEAVAKTNALKEEANNYYKTGSIADRARMVQQYNEKKNKK